MSDVVNPSQKRAIDSYKTAGLIKEVAGSNDFILSPPISSMATYASQIDHTSPDFGTFLVDSISGLDVTFEGGEAIIGGAWVARDTTTTVSLEPNTSGQEVYVGYDAGQPDSVILNVSDGTNFASRDPKLKIKEFDTDATSITSQTDASTSGPKLTPEEVDIAEDLQLPVHQERSDGSGVPGSQIYLTGASQYDYEPEGIYTYMNGNYRMTGGQALDRMTTFTIEEQDIASGSAVEVFRSAGGAASLYGRAYVWESRIQNDTSQTNSARWEIYDVGNSTSLETYTVTQNDNGVPARVVDLTSVNEFVIAADNGEFNATNDQGVTSHTTGFTNIALIYESDME